MYKKIIFMMVLGVFSFRECVAIDDVLGDDQEDQEYMLDEDDYDDLGDAQELELMEGALETSDLEEIEVEAPSRVAVFLRSLYDRLVRFYVLLSARKNAFKVYMKKQFGKKGPAVIDEADVRESHHTSA